MELINESLEKDIKSSPIKIKSHLIKGYNCKRYTIDIMENDGISTYVYKKESERDNDYNIILKQLMN